MKFHLTHERIYQIDFVLIRNISQNQYIYLYDSRIVSRFELDFLDKIYELFEKYFKMNFECKIEYNDKVNTGNMNSLYYHGTFILNDDDMFYLSCKFNNNYIKI